LKVEVRWIAEPVRIARFLALVWAALALLPGHLLAAPIWTRVIETIAATIYYLEHLAYPFVRTMRAMCCSCDSASGAKFKA